jgi:hypothetical protein
MKFNNVFSFFFGISLFMLTACSNPASQVTQAVELESHATVALPTVVPETVTPNPTSTSAPTTPPNLIPTATTQAVPPETNASEAMDYYILGQDVS